MYILCVLNASDARNMKTSSSRLSSPRLPSPPTSSMMWVFSIQIFGSVTAKRADLHDFAICFSWLTSTLHWQLLEMIEAYEEEMRRVDKAVVDLNGIKLSRYMRKCDVMEYIVWNASPVPHCFFHEMNRARIHELVFRSWIIFVGQIFLLSQQSSLVLHYLSGDWFIGKGIEFIWRWFRHPCPLYLLLARNTSTSHAAPHVTIFSHSKLAVASPENWGSISRWLVPGDPTGTHY